jgi:hypothetical protein
MIPLSSNPESQKQMTRAAGVAGVVGFLLIASGAALLPFWTALHTTDSPQAFVRYAQDQRGQIIAAMFLYSLGFGLFLVLTGALWAQLRRADRRAEWLAAVFGLAAVAMSTMILAAFVPACVFAYRAHSPEVAQTLWDLGFGMLALSGVPTAVCMGAYATATLCYGGLPRWTGWVAAVGVVPHVVIGGSFMVRDGFLSLEGDVTLWVPLTLFAWILAASIALVSQPRAKEARNGPGR